MRDCQPGKGLISAGAVVEAGIPVHPDEHDEQQSQN